MEAYALTSNLQHISGLGVGLNQSQKSALDTSLVIVKSNYKFSDVKFWGKIMGIKEDYFIIYGIQKDELNNRRFLYSLNGIDWHLLQDATADALAKSDMIRGRFIGDPSYEYEHVDVQRIGEGEEAHDEETVFTIKEEERLAVVVSRITNEFITPRGAYIKSPLNEVTRNQGFSGLRENDAKHLSNWFHFRSEMKRKMPSVADFAEADPAIDFMDTIEHDIPVGVWSIQRVRGMTITVRNLNWQGLISFILPETRLFGCVYFGTGEPNYDLPFML